MKKENQNHERKIEIISSIDDEIIERASKKRFELWGRVKKRNPWLLWGPMVAGAACVALLTVWLLNLLPIGGGKQIPIYQGMTVSNTAQTVAWAETEPEAAALSYEPLAASNGARLSRLRPLTLLNKDNNGNHYGNEKNPNGEAETSSLQLEGTRPLYYAQQNQDIYITIHFSNPDNFEILSFTLNGEKYSSYMFEEGSDMEHLILKKNVGNAEGVVEYTIDAIKYVDGTDIKDVQMNGDRTVKVGVYSENQPVATVEGLTPDFNALRMNVTVNDPLSLVSLSEGSLYAVLYQGETKVAEQALTMGVSTAVAFENLAIDTEYRYAIEAEYDNLSGEGVRRYTLKEETVRTLLALRIDAAEPTQTALSFRLTWNESYGQKELTSLALYQGETKLKDLPLETVQLTDLLSNNEYLIRATYLNGTETKTVDYTFKTLPVIDVTACTVTNTEAIVSGDTIFLRLDLSNPSGVNVTHVTVSGEKYAVTMGTAAFLLINIPCDESFSGGEATLTIEALEGTLDGKIYTLTPATEVSQTVFINGNLTVLGIEFVNESMEPVSWAFTSDTVYLMIRLENPTGYTVDRVTVNGTAYTPTKLSDNEYYCTVPTSKGANSLTLSSLSYHNENLERSLTLTETCNLMRLASNTVQYISTPEDLLNMNGGGYYELTGDVDLSGRQWQGSAISGVLNGKGYAVKNLTYIGVASDGVNIGLFSTAQGVIQNLSLENVNLVVQGEGELYVGALAGSSSRVLVIENCHVSGSISVSGSGSSVFAGGMVGLNNNILTITNSTNSGDVSANEGSIGGLVGGMDRYAVSLAGSITITTSTNSGDVSATTGAASYVGGLVGDVYASGSVTITNSTNSGAVSVVATTGTVESSPCAGGLVGSGRGTITNSTNSGAVSIKVNVKIFDGYVGGLVGRGSVTITNSTNSGAVSTDKGSTGGLVGDTSGVNHTVILTNSYTTQTYNNTDVLCTVEQLNTPSFYTDTLGWSLEIWDLSDLDVANGKYPKLK